MAKKKVLITGADGFIGSHLTEELVNNGFEVRAFVFYNSFNSNGWLDSIPNEIKNKLLFFFNQSKVQLIDQNTLFFV